MFTGVIERYQWHKMAKISKHQSPKNEKGFPNLYKYKILHMNDHQVSR